MVERKVKTRKFRDNAEFLEYIAQLAAQFSIDPRVDALANELYNKGGVRAIFDFVRNKVKYNKDPFGFEKITTPELMIEQYLRGEPISGDCDDKVLLLASLLMNKGFPVRIVGAHYLMGEGGRNEINHVYLEFKDITARDPRKREKWIPLDPSYSGKFGTKASSVIPIKYFVPKVNFIPISGNPMSMIGAYHTKFIRTYGKIDMSKVPILLDIASVTQDDELKELIFEAVKMIEAHGYITPEDARKLGAEKMHKLIAILGIFDYNVEVPDYYELMPASVEVAPIVVGAIVLFGVGFLVAKLAGASWSKALGVGVLAVAVGGLVYFGFSYLLGGSSTLLSALGLAKNMTDKQAKDGKISKDQQQRRNNTINATEQTVSGGGQIAQDPNTLNAINGDRRVPNWANANNLYDFYASFGKSVPKLSERAKMWEKFGLGKSSEYSGTAEQNAKLLAALKMEAQTKGEVSTSSTSTVRVSSSDRKAMEDANKNTTAAKSVDNMTLVSTIGDWIRSYIHVGNSEQLGAIPKDERENLPGTAYIPPDFESEAGGVGRRGIDYGKIALAGAGLGLGAIVLIPRLRRTNR